MYTGRPHLTSYHPPNYHIFSRVDEGKVERVRAIVVTKQGAKKRRCRAVHVGANERIFTGQLRWDGAGQRAVAEVGAPQLCQVGKRRRDGAVQIACGSKQKQKCNWKVACRSIPPASQLWVARGWCCGGRVWRGGWREGEGEGKEEGVLMVLVPSLSHTHTHHTQMTTTIKVTQRWGEAQHEEGTRVHRPLWVKALLRVMRSRCEKAPIEAGIVPTRSFPESTAESNRN